MDLWDKLNRRERILIIFIVVVLLPAAFYFYFYQPLLNQIEANKQRLNQVKTDFKAEKLVADNKSRLQKRYEDIKQQLTNNNKLVTKDVLSEVIVDLNQLAVENNLTLSALKPQQEEKVESYLKYPVNLQVVGSYKDMLNYLENIYQLDYLLRVEKIVFSLSDDSQLAMGIKIAGYTPVETSGSEED